MNHLKNACLSKTKYNFDGAHKKAINKKQHFYHCPYCSGYHLSKEQTKLGLQFGLSLKVKPKKSSEEKKEEIEQKISLPGWSKNRRLWTLYKRHDGKCAICGCETTLTYNSKIARQATVDHILPKSKGGSDEPTNLQLACKKCNEKKGNKVS